MKRLDSKTSKMYNVALIVIGVVIIILGTMSYMNNAGDTIGSSIISIVQQLLLALWFAIMLIKESKTNKKAIRYVYLAVSAFTFVSACYMAYRMLI